MTQAIMPKHILSEHVSRGEFSLAWGIDTKPASIVGTGPFRLAEYLSGERIILKKNAHYWKKDAQGNKLPYLDGILISIIPDKNTSLLKFVRGELDVFSVDGKNFAYLSRYLNRGSFRLFEIGPSWGSNFLAFNLNKELVGKVLEEKKYQWFSQLKFRQAIARAIDRRAMIDNILFGKGVPQYGPISPANKKFYNTNIPQQKYDIAAARELLKEAGFVLSAEGLRDAQGNLVKFNLLTNSEDKIRISIANIIRDDLAAIGITVYIKPLQFNVLVEKLVNTFSWDTVLLGLTGGPEPHGAKNVWNSKGQLHFWHPLQKEPQTSWEKEIDDLFDRGVVELDFAKRKHIYDRWQLIAARQLPLIYTVTPLSIYGVNTRLHNVKPSLYGGVLHNVEEISLKQVQ